jgi:hypothetical protein
VASLSCRPPPAGRQQPEQDRRGHVVRQVADHPYRGWLAREQRSQVGVEDVALDHMQRRGHRAWQRRGQVAIDLHRDHARDPRRQADRERSAPRPDLEEGVAGLRIDGGDHFLDPGRLEEVLAEALARAMRRRGRDRTPRGTAHGSSSSSGPSVSPRQ